MISYSNQVARLQLQVYEQLVQLKDSGRYPNINDALDELNSRLMDVTKVCRTENVELKT